MHVDSTPGPVTVTAAHRTPGRRRRAGATRRPTRASAARLVAPPERWMAERMQRLAASQRGVVARRRRRARGRLVSSTERRRRGAGRVRPRRPGRGPRPLPAPRRAARGRTAGVARRTRAVAGGPARRCRRGAAQPTAGAASSRRASPTTSGTRSTGCTRTRSSTASRPSTPGCEPWWPRPSPGATSSGCALGCASWPSGLLDGVDPAGFDAIADYAEPLAGHGGRASCSACRPRSRNRCVRGRRPS